MNDDALRAQITQYIKDMAEASYLYARDFQCYFADPTASGKYKDPWPVLNARAVAKEFLYHPADAAYMSYPLLKTDANVKLAAKKLRIARKHLCYLVALFQDTRHANDDGRSLDAMIKKWSGQSYSRRLTTRNPHKHEKSSF